MSSHDVLFTPTAESQLCQLSASEAGHAIRGIERLQKAPSLHSRHFDFPPPPHQGYDVDIERARTIINLHIRFHYTQDETAILIAAIGRSEIPKLT